MPLGKKRFIAVLAFTLILTLGNAVSAFAAFEYGDEGQEVMAIQKRLVELSYSLKSIDGEFGHETENAIKKFQTDRGLVVDGIVGSDTYRALMNKDIPPNRGRSSVVRKILRTAYSVIGTPYVFGGTSPYGFDCSGFTQYAFASAGVSIPRTADNQLYYGKSIPMSDLRVGDLVFYTTYAPGASHCGIYLGNGKFIHAGTSTGVTVASAFTGYWGARYYGACRIL